MSTDLALPNLIPPTAAALIKAEHAWAGEPFRSPISLDQRREAERTLARLNRLITDTVDQATVSRWLGALEAARLRYAPRGDDLTAYRLALGLVCRHRQLPRAVFTEETQALAIERFKDWPPAGDIRDMLGEIAARHLRVPALMLRRALLAPSASSDPEPAANRSEVARALSRWPAEPPDRAALRKRSLAAVRSE